MHAGAALGQAGAVITLRTLAKAPIASVVVTVPTAGASQLLGMAAVARLTPW